MLNRNVTKTGMERGCVVPDSPQAVRTELQKLLRLVEDDLAALRGVQASARRCGT